MMRFGLLLALFALSVSPANAQVTDDPCGAVFKDGTMTRLEIANSEYAKILFGDEIASASYSEARDVAKSKGGASIGDVSFNASSSEEEHEKFRDEFRRKISLNAVRDVRSSYYSTRGDKGLVDAWLECKRLQGGLSLRVEPRDGDLAVVFFAWWPTAGSDPSVSLDAPTVIGGKMVDGSGGLKIGSRLGFGENQFFVEREKGKPLSIIVNIKVGNSSVSGERSLPAPIPELVVDKLVCKKQFVSTGIAFGNSKHSYDFDRDGCLDLAWISGNGVHRLLDIDFGDSSKQQAQKYLGDAGYPDYGRWIDLENDGALEYCTFVGTTKKYYMKCISGDAVTSGRLGSSWVGARRFADRGYPDTISWRDVNGDGLQDYCSGVGKKPPNHTELCHIYDGAQNFQ